MHKYIMLLYCGLALASLAQASQDGSSILTLPHRALTLPNGLRVFMVKYPSPGVVAYELPVHAGSRNEVEPGKTGFAHFFEHLMFRGTKKRTSKAFNELYVKLGCENNAWTSTDMTDYHGVVAKVYLPKILDAESDRFEHLTFDEKALRDEAGAVLGEYNKDVASPEFALEEKLMSTAYKVHPYAHTTMGYKEDILKFTERYKDVWPFFRRYYQPAKVSVVLVGDLDFDKSLADIRAKFGVWKASKQESVEIKPEPEQTAPRQAEVKLEKPTQTRISMAYKVPAFSTHGTDTASAELLADLLFSVTSEFQKKYRFEKKWLDSVSASGGESVDPGLWTVSLRLSEAGEGKDKELIEAVESTIAGARTHAPEAERLAAVKKRYQNSALVNWFGSPESLASRISWYTNFEPDLGVLDRLFERVREVTPETLTRFASKYLVDARKTTVILHGGHSK